VIVYSGGGGPGGNAFFCFDKTRRRGVVVLSATDDTDGQLGSFLLGYCEWRSDRRPVETKTGTQAYDGYLGQYRAVAGQSQAVIGIRRAGDRLFAQSTGPDSWLVGVLLPPGGGELLPESENRFLERLSGTRLSFSRYFWGRVTCFTAHCQGTEFVYKRISDQPPKAPEPLRRPVAVKLDTELLEACAGHYEFPPDAIMPGGLKLTITREGDHLVWRERALGINFYPESKTNFFDTIGGVQLTFLKNDQGEVTAVIARDDIGREHKGVKLRGAAK